MAFNWEDPRPIPKIKVDSERCAVPLTCKKCLELCTQAVFALDTLKYVKFQENSIHDPGAYKITPRHSDKCSGCMDCVEVCPENAISILFAEGEKK